MNRIRDKWRIDAVRGHQAVTPRMLGDYLRIVRDKKTSVFAIVSLALFAGIFAAMTAEPVYRAETTLFVELPEHASNAKLSPLMDMADETAKREQMELLTSRKVADEVIERLNLNKHPELLDVPFSQSLETLFHDGETNSEAMIKERLVDAFRARLNIDLGRDGSIVKIQYSSSDRELAAAVANEVAHVYKNSVSDKRNEASEENLVWLRAKLDEAKRKLTESELAFTEYQNQVKMGDLASENSLLSNKINSISTQLIKARTQRAAAEIRYNQINIYRSKNDQRAIKLLITEPRYLQAIDDTERARRNIDDMRERYGEKHPKLIAAIDEHQVMSQRVNQEIENFFESVKKAYELAIADEQLANTSYKELQAEMLSARKSKFGLAMHELEIRSNRELYDLLMKKTKESEINLLNLDSQVKVFERAIPPVTPYKPNRLAIFLVTLLIGVFIGVSQAVARANMDNRFDSGEFFTGNQSKGGEHGANVTPLRLHSPDIPRNYLKGIRHRKWSFMAIVSVALIVGFYVAVNAKPAFRAEATLMAELPDSTAEIKLSPMSTLGDEGNYLRNQIELLNSRWLAQEVISRLRLKEHPEFAATMEASMPGGIAESFLSADTAVSDENAADQYAVNAFRLRLKIEAGSGGNVIKIQYVSADPNLVATVANEVAKVYIESVTAKRNAASVESMSWLKAKTEEAKQKLAQAEATLAEYENEIKVADKESEQRLSSSRLQNISTQLVRARTERAAAEILYQQVNIYRSRNDYRAIKALIKDKQFPDLVDDETKARKNLESLRETYGDQHPKLSAALANYQLAAQRVNDAVDKFVERVTRSFELAVADEKQVGRMYDDIQAELLTTRTNKLGLAMHEMEVNSSRELYKLLLAKLQESEINAKKLDGQVQILDAAVKPLSPYKPNRLQIFSVAALLGLFLAIAQVVIREVLDDTFKTGEDLETKTQLPMLGILPLVKTGGMMRIKAETLFSGRRDRSFNEAVNQIRTNIVLSNDKNARVIMVTSAISSEGKTTVSCNLAASLARTGKTLLIEADTRKPRMRNILASRSKSGFFELVAGLKQLKDCVTVDQRNQNLHILPVTTRPENPTEFLASPRVKQVLEQLKTEYKYIVIDAPPVLPVSDALVLSQSVDGVVFVAAAEQTRHRVVETAIDRLNKAHAPMLGVVLSMANLKTIRTYAGPTYYGYSDYKSTSMRLAS